MSVSPVSESPNDPSDSPWYLAYSKPRSEFSASAQLDRQGYATYLPLYKSLRRTPDGMVVQRDPMFPRYVFFQPGRAGQSIAPVRSTLGVSNIVQFGVAPATVSGDLIDALRDFERQREQADPALISPLKAGRRVAICAGPLKGLEGMVCGTAGQRVSVLLDMLGRQPRVDILDHHLEVLAA